MRVVAETREAGEVDGGCHLIEIKEPRALR